jgi:HD-GYP domain-containing protein (c-di-GMP phosphodiesterase class II)
MSDFHRISLHDIVVGQPLRWDVMDSSGHLLLRAGFVVSHISQVEALVTRGMYIDQAHFHHARSEPSTPAKAETPSVLRSINMAVKRLEIVLRDLHLLPDVRAKILEIVKVIHNAVHMNEDLALASIQLIPPDGNYSVRHSVDSAILSILVAQAMNKSAQEIQDIAAAALTMNIAMKGMHEKLQRTKEALSAEDKASIRHHPMASMETLYDVGVEDAAWLLYVLMHHEHEDGSGYPAGRLKAEIPQNAKILAIADGYCARISVRGYRKTMLPHMALRDIFVENGAQVDATLSSYFINVLGLHPPGTFVRLKNGEVAVVSHRGDKPGVSVAHALVKPNNEVFSTPVKRDTSMAAFNIVEALHPGAAAVQINMQQIWGPQACL